MPSISHPISAQPIKGASRLDGRRQASSWCDLLTTLATKLYFMRVPVHLSDAYSRPIRVVSISDTHNQQPDLPDGDLLLHGGDLTQNGTFEELQAQLDWLNSQKHHCKVVIGGKYRLRSFIYRTFQSADLNSLYLRKSRPYLGRKFRRPLPRADH